MNRLAMWILLLAFWGFLTWPAEVGPSYLYDLGTGAVMAEGVGVGTLSAETPATSCLRAA